MYLCDDALGYLPLSPQQFQILLALSDGDRHGYGIILEIAERTAGSVRLGTGTLYTALAGLVDSAPRSPNRGAARRATNGAAITASHRSDERCSKPKPRASTRSSNRPGAKA